MKKIFSLLLLVIISVFSGIFIEEKFDTIQRSSESQNIQEGEISQKQSHNSNDGDSRGNSSFSWLIGGSEYQYLKNSERHKVSDNLDLEKVNLVYSLLQKYYNTSEEISSEKRTKKLEEWLIRGVVYSFDDPHTEFFNEEQGNAFEDDMAGDFEGIGAALEKQKGQLVITEVMKGRPAALEGLLPGDIILKIDEKSVEDETIWDSVRRIRGKKGTKVALEIFRPGKNESENFLTLSPVRDTIHVESVKFSWKGKNSDIAVFEISQFGDEMIAELEKNLIAVKERKKELKKSGKNLSGIIIDLRYNGGGYLNGAVDLASYFLPEKTKIVSISSKNIENNNEYFTEKTFFRDDFLDDTTPLIVLINGGSASASEIFAGAMQELKRGELLGTKTYGKGSVQQIFPLEENPNEFLKITIAKWLLPSGKNLTHEEPLSPDINIEWKPSEMTDKQRLEKYDPQMEKAIEVLEKK